MQASSRRRFIAGVSALAASGLLSRAVQAAMGPNDKFDLLIKGGEVLDPSQKLRARRRPRRQTRRRSTRYPGSRALSRRERSTRSRESACRA